MLSMILATCGWGVWWLALVSFKLIEGWRYDSSVPSIVAGAFAVPGLVLALLSLRGRRAWLLLALVPVFSNASLLVFPTVLDSLVDRAASGEQAEDESQ